LSRAPTFRWGKRSNRGLVFIEPNNRDPTPATGSCGNIADTPGASGRIVSLREETIVTTLRPGQDAPVSGQYGRVGPRGGRQPGKEVTAVRGKPLPPTPKPGMGYVLVDATKHENKR
jgi:hypothetical protein